MGKITIGERKRAVSSGCSDGLRKTWGGGAGRMYSTVTNVLFGWSGKAVA